MVLYYIGGSYQMARFDASQHSETELAPGWHMQMFFFASKISNNQFKTSKTICNLISTEVYNINKTMRECIILTPFSN